MIGIFVYHIPQKAPDSNAASDSNYDSIRRKQDFFIDVVEPNSDDIKARVTMSRVFRSEDGYHT
jgi:hypothetical protein